jgi:hypothetical protein
MAAQLNYGTLAGLAERNAKLIAEVEYLQRKCMTLGAGISNAMHRTLVHLDQTQGSLDRLTDEAYRTQIRREAA